MSNAKVLELIEIITRDIEDIPPPIEELDSDSELLEPEEEEVLEILDSDEEDEELTLESFCQMSWSTIDDATAAFNKYALANGFCLNRGTSRKSREKVVWKAFCCHRHKTTKDKGCESLEDDVLNAVDLSLDFEDSSTDPSLSSSQAVCIPDETPAAPKLPNHTGCPYRLNISWSSLKNAYIFVKPVFELAHNHPLLPKVLIRYSAACRKLDDKVINHIKVLVRGKLDISVRDVIPDIIKTFPEYGGNDQDKLLLRADVSNIMRRVRNEKEQENQAWVLIEALIEKHMKDPDFFFRFQNSGKFQVFHKTLFSLCCRH